MEDVSANYKGDALGFLSPQGQPPLAAAELAASVDLLHVTAAIPFAKRTNDVLDGSLTPDGVRRIPGLTDFRSLIESQPQLDVVTTSSDIATIKAAGKTAILLGVQQAPHNASVKDLQKLYENGLRVMALEYRDGNQQYGSGWMNPEGGLTDTGRDLIANMSDIGLILDVSHSGDTTARDALHFVLQENLELPVMASHGGVFESYNGNQQDINNRRNLRRDTLDLIRELGGIVGLYSLTFGLSGNDNGAETFYEQLYDMSNDYPDNLVIGSDAVYATRQEDEWINTFDFLKTNVAGGTDMEPRYPDTPLELNTVNRLDIIENQLVLRGLGAARASSIVGGNLRSFLERSLS